MFWKIRNKTKRYHVIIDTIYDYNGGTLKEHWERTHLKNVPWDVVKLCLISPFWGKCRSCHVEWYSGSMFTPWQKWRKEGVTHFGEHNEQE